MSARGDQLEAAIKAREEKMRAAGGEAKIVNDPALVSWKTQLETERKKDNEADVGQDLSAAGEALNPFENVDPEARDRAIGIIDPASLPEYGTGDRTRYMTQEETLEAPEFQQSNAAGITSAWDGKESAFGGLGPSAYEDLTFDQGSLDHQNAGADYFANIMSGGTDAVAERDYERRAADAEQRRRSNTDAALAQLEMSGQSGMGSNLLAELSNQQAASGDIYNAGIDANAIAQQRRDSAATSRAGIAHTAGQDAFTAMRDRASGMDAFKRLVAAGMDEWEAAKATGMDATTLEKAGLMDTDRDRFLDRDFAASGFNAEGYRDLYDDRIERERANSDANVSAAHRVIGSNAGKTAAGTGTYLQALGMEGGNALVQGNLDLSRDEFAYEEAEDEERDDERNTEWWRDLTIEGLKGATKALAV